MVTRGARSDGEVTVPTGVLAMLGTIFLMFGVILLFGDEPVAGLVLCSSHLSSGLSGGGCGSEGNPAEPGTPAMPIANLASSQ